MKKLYTSFLAVAAAMTVCAQQLPNPGFEGEWSDYTPWTSKGNTKATGTTPEGWNISHVIGMNGLGATVVGEEAVGYNSDKSVRLFNQPNEYSPTQIVPGYITFGTPWSTANGLEVLGGNFSNSDGGTFGGREFTSRPDGLAFDYKFTCEGEIPEGKVSKASVVAYTWKGSWTQAAVPGEIYLFGAATTCDMVDRDRNILGIQANKGGEITKSDDAELICKINTTIEETAADWTIFVKEFEYASTAAPEKLNIILASNDYFGDASTIKSDDSFFVDNVRLVYYSRLATLRVNGVALEGFDSNKYEYEMPETDCPESELAFSQELLKNVSEASVTVALDKANAVATFTVKNENGADVDGKDTHVYTVKFKAPEADEVIEGTLDIEMNGGMIAEDQPAKLNFYKTGDNTCTIILPDFALDLGDGPTPLGDIVVPDVNVSEDNGTKTYTGEVEGMKLLGGQIEADVTLNGTQDAAGNVDMNINVTWMGMPIIVTFTGHNAGIGSVIVEDNAPVEYYNIGGVRVAEENLTPGLYIRRQGSDVKKVYVK